MHMVPSPPAEYANPSVSNTTQLKLVYFPEVPNVPLKFSLFVASAGFQNFSSFKPTVANLKSSGFFDQATFIIFSFDASIVIIYLFLLIL